MPFWQVFAPENAFTDEDKQALAESITSMYTDFVNLPKFYVVVSYHMQPPNSMYVGGKPANKPVKIDAMVLSPTQPRPRDASVMPS